MFYILIHNILKIIKLSINILKNKFINLDILVSLINLIHLSI